MACGISDRLFYTHTHSGSPTPEQGQIVEVALQQVSGGGSLSTAFLSGFSGATEDASSGYEWEVRVTATTDDEAELWDATAGAQVSGFGTLDLDWSNIYEFRVEQRSSTVQGWYRVYTVFSDRLWIEWGSGTLTSTGGSGTPTSQATFGAKHAFGASAASTTFSAVRVCYGEMTGARSLDFTNPDDLYPRAYSGVGAGVVIDGNHRISAVGGPGRRGDVYTDSPSYPDPIDVTFWPDSLSMQEYWRSTEGSSSPDCDAHTLIYPISDAGEDTRLSPVIGVFFGGVRALRTGSIILETHMGATTTHAFDLSYGGVGLTFARIGNTVVINAASGGSSGRFLRTNEAAGWWLHLDSGAGVTAWVEVERNEEGVYAGGAGMPARFYLKEATTAMPASGTMRLVPTQAVITINTQNAEFKLLKVVVDSQETPDGRAQIASIWPGDVFTVTNYENGARFTTVHGSDQGESAGRVSTATRRAPARREFELAWSALAYTGSVAGDNSDPNFHEATDHASALPAGVPEAIPYSIEGLYHYLNGERPVVVVPCLPRQGSGVQSRVTTGRWSVIPALVTGVSTMRDVAGVAGTTSEKKRGEALAFRELV